MLLELPVPVLSQMLQDEASLTAAVEKALNALQGTQESRYSKLIFETRLPYQTEVQKLAFAICNHIWVI